MVTTNLILLGSICSISLSFFQKTCGVGEASILHSRLTVSPSRALEFNSFWINMGGWRTSWAAHRDGRDIVTHIWLLFTFMELFGVGHQHYL